MGGLFERSLAYSCAKMAASLLLLLGQALAVRASGRVHPARDPMAATALLGRADPSASLRRRRTPRRRTRAPEAEQRLRLCASPFAARAPLAALTRLPRALVPAPLLAGGDERRRPWSMLVRQTDLIGDVQQLSVLRLPDRRQGAGSAGDVEWVLTYFAELLAARLRNETWIDVEICDVTTIVVAAPTLAPTTRWPTTAEPSYAPTSSPSPEPTPAPTVDPTPEPTPTPTSFAGVFFILPSLCHHAP